MNLYLSSEITWQDIKQRQVMQPATSPYHLQTLHDQTVFFGVDISKRKKTSRGLIDVSAEE